MKIYLTSDLHLGHSVLVEQGFRYFWSVEQMNEIITYNICNRSPEDRIFFLGDIALGKNKVDFFKEIIFKNDVVIKGNHDPQSLSMIESMVIKWRGVHFELVHNPNDASGKCKYVIHGHIHKTGNRNFDHPVKKLNKYIHTDGNIIYYNVNVEFHKYKPKLINEILGEILLCKKELKK